jgi:zinc transporter 1/2/3
MLPIFRCLMIVIALSFHSIFEGLAIGLQDTAPHVWQLLVAVSVHKLLLAFVVGLDVYNETKSIGRVLVYMVPFATMSPLGVLIASFTKMGVNALVEGVLTAIATGSLLYITFFEILLRERSCSKLSGFLQFFAVLLGFSLMVLLQQLTEHEH